MRADPLGRDSRTDWQSSLAQPQQQAKEYGECSSHFSGRKHPFAANHYIIGAIAEKQKRPLFRFCFGLFDLLDEFGGIFVEILQAAFAAKLDLTAFVREDVRITHFA